MYHLMITWLIMSWADPVDEGCRVLCIRDGFSGGQKYKKGCVCLEVKPVYGEYAKGLVRVGFVDRRPPLKIEFSGEPFEEQQ